MLESASHGSEIGNVFSVFRVALHRAVAEAQSKSGVRRLGKSTLCESRLGNGGALAAFDGIHLVIELFTDGSRVGIDGSHRHDERIVAGLHRGGASLIKLLAEGDIIQDRKSTRLNSSHVSISYAVFCLKKKKKIKNVYNHERIR